MNLWWWVLLAAVIAYLTKLVGYLVPAKVLENPRISRVAGTLTIGLLASLTMVNAAASGTEVVFDSRIGALVAAAIALWFKAPFLVVVLVGALAAAGMRLLGWP